MVQPYMSKLTATESWSAERRNSGAFNVSSMASSRARRDSRTTPWQHGAARVTSQRASVGAPVWNATSRRFAPKPVARQPALLGYFPGTLERNLRAIAAALVVPFARVQPLLLKQPALVMLARGSLRERVASLRDAAGLYDNADLASVVLRQPSLLTLSPETVRHKIDVVTQVLELEDRPDELRTVLRGAPQVLTLAADSIRTKAAALRAAVAPYPALRAQLLRAPPQTVAMWLCLSSRRYEHVRAVAEAALTATEAEATLGVPGVTESATTQASASIDVAGGSASRRARMEAVKAVGASRMATATMEWKGKSYGSAADADACRCADDVQGGGGYGGVADVKVSTQMTTKRRRGRLQLVPVVDPIEAARRRQQECLPESDIVTVVHGGALVSEAAAASATAVSATGMDNEEGVERGFLTRPRLSLYALLRAGGLVEAPGTAAAVAAPAAEAAGPITPEAEIFAMATAAHSVSTAAEVPELAVAAAVPRGHRRTAAARAVMHTLK
ncbi:hypothetical protein Vafri_9224, partial [Volvox africanus]